PGTGLQRRSDWSLLVTFASACLAVAAVTDLQAGGNINYFFDALFAAVPLAVLGVLRLGSLARRSVAVGLWIAVLLVFHDLAPRALALLESHERFMNRSVEIQSANRAFRVLETTLHGQRIFSTVPRLALIDPAPTLTEPFLLSYLLRLKKIDPEPILKPVRNGDFHVVITLTESGESWRGVPHVAPIVRETITAAYKPHCRLLGSVFYLPRQLHPGS